MIVAALRTLAGLAHTLWAWPSVLLVSSLMLAGATTMPGYASRQQQSAVPEEPSGYTVTGVHYLLDATDAGRIRAVRFTLDDAATVVRISLDEANETWHECRAAGDTTWLCETAGETVRGAVGLRVVASS